MSAEKEALKYLDEIFMHIRETLEDAKIKRGEARQLTNEENKALSAILTNIKKVRNNLNSYLEQFRIQTRLDDFGLDMQ